MRRLYLGKVKQDRRAYDAGDHSTDSRDCEGIATIEKFLEKKTGRKLYADKIKYLPLDDIAYERGGYLRENFVYEQSVIHLDNDVSMTCHREPDSVERVEDMYIIFVNRARLGTLSNGVAIMERAQTDADLIMPLMNGGNYAFSLRFYTDNPWPLNPNLHPSASLGGGGSTDNPKMRHKKGEDVQKLF